MSKENGLRPPADVYTTTATEDDGEATRGYTVCARFRFSGAPGPAESITIQELRAQLAKLRDILRDLEYGDESGVCPRCYRYPHLAHCDLAAALRADNPNDNATWPPAGHTR